MIRIRNCFLFLLLFCFSPKYLFAQNRDKTIDSLLAVLGTIKEDILRIQVMNKLGKRYIHMAKYDEGTKYSSDAIALANRIINLDNNRVAGMTNAAKKGLGNAYNNLALVHFNKSNYAEALKNNNIALKVFVETGDKNGIASS